MDKLDSFVAHPVFWGVFTLVLAAFGLSGRLSVNAANVFLILAWLLGCFGIYRSGISGNPRILFMFYFLFAAILCGLSAWMQPVLAPAPEIKSTLKLEIRMFNGGQSKDNPTTAFFRVVALVSNPPSSLPTIARDWSLEVVNKGVSTPAVLTYFPPGKIEMQSRTTGTTATWDPETALYKKAAKPIPPGETIDGVIQFEAKNFDTKSLDDDTIFVLSAADMLGNRSSAKTTLKELNSMPPQLFPSSTPSDSPAQQLVKRQKHAAVRFVRITVDRPVVGNQLNIRIFLKNKSDQTLQVLGVTTVTIRDIEKNENLDTIADELWSKLAAVQTDTKTAMFPDIEVWPTITTPVITQEILQKLLDKTAVVYVMCIFRYKDDDGEVLTTNVCFWFFDGPQITFCARHNG